MRIILHELKKIWNIKSLFVVALICALFYFLFLSQFIDFPNGHSTTEEVEYSIEMLQRYGTTLEEDEISEFTSENREKLIAEMEMYIKRDPIFADAGIYSFEDYERVANQPTNSEVESKAIWALLGKEYDFVRFKLQALEWIESQYQFYPTYASQLISDSISAKEIERLTEILETKEYTNIMDWNVYENTVGYTVFLANLSILSVFVLVSPLIVIDRSRNVYLLQYSSKQGRKILQKQFIAVLLSAFMLTTILILIFGAIYSTNGTWIFWNSSLTSFLNSHTFWFDITYGEYVVVYILLLYILCLSTAALAFLCSRFSRNLVTLILKLIPIFALLVLFSNNCIFIHMFSFSHFLYWNLGLIGMEPIISGIVFILCVGASLYFVRREKAIEVA